MRFGLKTGPEYREQIEFPFFESHLKGDGSWAAPLTTTATVWVSARFMSGTFFKLAVACRPAARINPLALQKGLQRITGI